VIAAGDELGAAREAHGERGLAGGPVREHLRGHVAADAVDLLGAEDDVAHPQIGDRPGAAVGEQHAGGAREAVDAGVRAAAVGVDVHRNGTGDDPGTRLSAERASTSWKTMPANSGVRTVRRSPSRPGKRLRIADAVIAYPLPVPPHAPFEHKFDSRAIEPLGRCAGRAPGAGVGTMGGVPPQPHPVAGPPPGPRGRPADRRGSRRSRPWTTTYTGGRSGLPTRKSRRRPRPEAGARREPRPRRRPRPRHGHGTGTATPPRLLRAVA
jgi:hypothetical protein